MNPQGVHLQAGWSRQANPASAQDAQRGPSPPAATRSPCPQSPHLTRNHSGRGHGHSVTQNAQWESQHRLGNNRVLSLKPRPPSLRCSPDWRGFVQVVMACPLDLDGPTLGGGQQAAGGGGGGYIRGAAAAMCPGSLLQTSGWKSPAASWNHRVTF